ncbi:SDR family oxidoreductase [Modestobacter sp. SYSU DS0875]
MSRILITGATGLLGQVLCSDLADQHQVTALTRTRQLHDPRITSVRADIRDEAALAAIWRTARPDLVVHTAALASVDECERDPDRAWAENAVAPGLVAGLCADHGSRLVHVSTDAVFDGVRGHYTEDDRPGPRNVYARSKLAGEGACLERLPGALVARVNFYGWSASGTRSLAEFFHGALSAGRTVRGFTDSEFTPLYSRDLGDLLVAAAAAGVSGVRHVGAREPVTKYEFGRQVARVFGFDPDLVLASRSDDDPARTVRSPRLSLDSGRLAAELGRAVPSVEEGLARMRTDLATGYPDLLRAQTVPQQPQIVDEGH